MDDPKLFDGEANPLASIVASALGGVVGVIFTPPKTYREGAWRVVVSIVSGFFLTPWVVEWMKIPPEKIQKVLSINAGIGAVSWITLGVVFFMLEQMATKAREEGPVGFIGYILHFFRGPAK